MRNIKNISDKFQNLNINYQVVLFYRIALLMLLFSISRLGFYFFNSEHFTGITFQRFLKLMAGGLKFDFAGIMFVNSLYILLYLLPLPFRTNKFYRGFLKWLFFITNGIALASNAGDFFYFSFIMKRSTSDVLMFAKEGNILTLFGEFLIDYWPGFVFWISQVLIMVVLYNRLKFKDIHQEKKWKFYGSAFFWLLVSLYFAVVGMRGGFTGTTRPITIGNAGAYTEKPIEMAIVLNTPFTIIKTLNRSPLSVPKYFEEQKLEEIYTPLHPADTTGEFKPLNVVVIIMESFAKEYVGALNRHLDNNTYTGYTPFLDSLIGVSKSFNLAFANGRKSIDALPSVVASIPSMVNPYVTSPYASNEINSLASLLKNKGYLSAFFHGAPNGSMGFDAFMKIAGFDRYYGMSEYGNDADYDGSWGIWDEEFMLYMNRQLGQFKEPFLAAFFSVSSHHPFKVPEKYEGKFRKGTLDFHIPIQYSDLALRHFFKEASLQPWYKNTIFVLTADHSNHAWHDVYKTTIGDFSVPLLFYQPGNPDLKGADSTVVQQMDIMPTILHYLNYDGPYISFGFNAFDQKEKHFAVNYNNNIYQIIRGNYVLQFMDGKSIALFNYIQDPLLNNNLLDKEPKRQIELETLLKAFIQQYNSRMVHNNLAIKN
ncbi:MAG: sulfatase-like hydrolase/transferase [Bacteroidales bacterium]